MADAADAGRGQPAVLTLSRFCFAMYASCKSGFSSASFFSSDSVLPIWPDNEMLCEIEKYFLPAMPETRAAGTALGFVPCLGLGLTLSVPQFPHLSMELSEYPPHGGRGNGKRSAQAPVRSERSVWAAGLPFSTFQGFCDELLCEGKGRDSFKKILTL